MIERIELKEICFRNFTTLDEAALLEILAWRNSERVRSKMVHSKEISPEEHLQFCASLKERSDPCMYSVDCNGIPCGVITYRKIDPLKHSAESGAYYITGSNIPAKSALYSEVLRRSLGFKEIYSYIKKSNLQAVMFKLFKTKSKICDEDDDYIYFKEDVDYSYDVSSQPVKVIICE